MTCSSVPGKLEILLPDTMSFITNVGRAASRQDQKTLESTGSNEREISHVTYLTSNNKNQSKIHREVDRIQHEFLDLEVTKHQAQELKKMKVLLLRRW